MTDIGNIADLLAELAKDPKKLLAAIQKMDKDGNHTVTTAEIINWVADNARDIQIDGKNLANDVKELSSSTGKTDDQAKYDMSRLQVELYKVATLVKKTVNEANEMLETIRNDTGPVVPEPEMEDPQDKKDAEFMLNILKKSKDPAIKKMVVQLEKGEDAVALQKSILKVLKQSNDPDTKQIAEDLEKIIKDGDKGEPKEKRDPHAKEKQEQPKKAEEERARIAEEQGTLDPKIKAQQKTYEGIALYKFDDVNVKELGEMMKQVVGTVSANEKGTTNGR